MSGLKIISATYGYGPNTVDITSTIDGLVKDGSLSTKVNTDLLKVSGMADPAPDEKKTLTLKYTINDGEININTYEDRDTANITAPPSSGTGLEIDHAAYGEANPHSMKFINVTNAVKSAVKNGSIHLKVSSENLGVSDPAPGKPKHLSVTYNLNKQRNEIYIPDGETFSLSAPPQGGNGYKASTTSFNFTEYIFQFITSIFGSILYGFGWMAAAFAWYDTFSLNYGDTMSYLAFAFGFLAGVPGVFLLVLFVFFRRILVTTDLALTLTPSIINNL